MDDAVDRLAKFADRSVVLQNDVRVQGQLWNSAFDVVRGNGVVCLGVSSERNMARNQRLLRGRDVHVEKGAPKTVAEIGPILAPTDSIDDDELRRFAALDRLDRKSVV